jgi:phospholipid/cholesterol/gamma-HCH transport system permease protein
VRPLFAMGRFTWFTVDFLRAAWRRPPPLVRSIEEAYKIGVRSLPILFVIACFVGTNLTLQGYLAFQTLGGSHLVGMFVGLAGIRELAPLIAGAMVAAKAGTEMASQIAVMRIQEEIDALEVMAVSPHWYLVTPRLLGIVLVMPALTFIAMAGMVTSAWAVAVFQLDLNGPHFAQTVLETMSSTELIFGAVKSIVFGTVICLISCYCGFHSKPGPEGVGLATNHAVVASSVSCLAMNYLVSEIVYG